MADQQTLENAARMVLSADGAANLRALAEESMPKALANIEESNNNLQRLLSRYSDENLGVHYEEYVSMTTMVKRQLAEAQEALEELVPKMEETADHIEAAAAPH